MSYKFIVGTENQLTAAGLDAITSLEISGIFPTQTEEFSFRIANTGSAEAHFNITSSGVNSSVLTDVTFSDDNGLTFETTAQVSGVQPNAVSERVVGRYTPSAGSVLGVGSFLVRVDEE